MTVIGRALGAGAQAGALSGAAAVLVFVAASALHAGPGAVEGGELLGATLNYLVLAVLIGTTTGAALAVPVGLVLGLMHGSIGGRVHRARAATALLAAGAVLLLGVVLSALGTASGYLSLLVVPALVVAAAVGAWRGPHLLGVLPYGRPRRRARRRAPGAAEQQEPRTGPRRTTPGPRRPATGPQPRVPEPREPPTGPRRTARARGAHRPRT